MKYMTPAILARSRSQDDTVAEVAIADWEQACARYNNYLERIQSSFPRSVRKLLQPNSNLHDAKVLTMTADEVAHFSFFLEVSNPHKQQVKYLELRYRLVGEIKRAFRLTKHPDLAGDGKPL